MMNERPTNPGIGYILLEKRVKEMEKIIEEKDALIARQKQEIASLLEGINLPGWWCIASVNGVPCDTFNGEAHSKRLDCRHCGELKPNQKA